MDLDTHITDVVNVLVYEDLRDVVLVGHSYAGMVITGVADRALDRIGHLVFLDAAQPRNGEALVDLVAGLEHLKDAGTMVDGVQLILTPDNGHTYGVTDPDTCAWMLQRLTPHPWRTFSQPLVLEHEAEVLGLPSTAITCPDTLERQPTQNNIARANAADNVWHLDGGHDLMLVDPEGVVELPAPCGGLRDDTSGSAVDGRPELGQPIAVERVPDPLAPPVALDETGVAQDS